MYKNTSVYDNALSLPSIACLVTGRRGGRGFVEMQSDTCESDCYFLGQEGHDTITNTFSPSFKSVIPTTNTVTKRL